MGKKNKSSTPKFRHKLIMLVIEGGERPFDVAKKYGIGYSTLHSWVSNFKKNKNKIMMDDDSESSIDDQQEAETPNTATPNQSQLQEYRNIIKKLRAEKEILKKTIAILMVEN